MKHLYKHWIVHLGYQYFLCAFFLPKRRPGNKKTTWNGFGWKGPVTHEKVPGTPMILGLGFQVNDGFFDPEKKLAGYLLSSVNVAFGVGGVGGGTLRFSMVFH